MRDTFEAWRRDLWIWLVPAVVAAIGIAGLAVYTSTFAGQVEALEEAYERDQENLEALRVERERVDALLARIEDQEAASNRLYDGYFGSESERFTQVLREIRGLARQAGLDPKRIGYPKNEIDDYGLARRSIVFSVTGTYDELRTFLNLVELTDQFFTLETVGLGAGEGDTLSINLELSTLFRAEGSSAVAGERAALVNAPVAGATP
ncbi:MAG: hypothetical protein AAGN46_10700 [Acidobacteriota bacterium]